MDSHEFLHLLWSNQPGPGYIILARRTNGRWLEIPGVQYDEHLTLDPLIWFPEEGDDYFCPQLFQTPNRRKENALPSRWLYADLDVVDPREIPDGIVPTISLQTSPGRYQAFWLLRLPLAPADHSQLNRNLTYALAADKGGWDITQVLRIPGTYNRKYMRPYKVRVLSHDPSLVYDVKVFENYFQNIKATLTTDLVDMPPLIMPVEKPLELRQKFWPKLNVRAQWLLQSSRPGPEDDRSARLWELECLLLEAGLTPEETFVLVRDSVWNKFAGRHGGDKQLWVEVQKADARVKVSFTVEGRHRLITKPTIRSAVERLSNKVKKPSWLIKDWWTTGSQGVIAGLPKSFKSLIAMEMAVSVATGTPFLNKYPVTRSHPVLIVQLENSQGLVDDRLLKIGHSRGLGPKILHSSGSEMGVELPREEEMPLYFYEETAFNMTLPDDQQVIEETVRDRAIKLVVFDPLYMMLGGADENHIKELRPVLAWLMSLRTNYNCSVVVVHHFTKSGTHPLTGVKQGGAKMLGSTLFWGWLECAIYLENPNNGPNDDGYTHLVVEREFRERPPIGPRSLAVRIGKMGNYAEYNWIVKSMDQKGNGKVEDAPERSYHP